MHKVSRTLLLAGVLAFGTLTAACGDKVELTQVGPVIGVSVVTVSPSNASINVGTTIQLAASVTADATTAKTVSWTTSSAAVATVDQTGKVTGVTAGTVTIIATATADASKQSAAAITVVGGPAVPIQTPLSIGINSVTDVFGNPVQLGNANGQVNVTINSSGGGLIEVFLSTACTTNTIATTDVAVASQQATSAQAGQVTLSFNTAQLSATNAPRFANGNYCIKTRLTNGTATVTATNTVPLTLNNVNSFRSTATFASQTSGPTSAVSSINGLNYNQGTLTATITPVIFTSANAVAFISGYLTRTGEQSGGASPGVAAFTNVTVTAGVATIVFPDTAFAAASRSIFQYTSLASGDTLVITSATDISGNSIALPNNNVVAAGFAGLRIDNDIPSNVGATYTVIAPNGYVAGSYVFSSGTAGTAAADTRGGIAGVGGVTTTYFVGLVGAAGFATANSCDVTGLTASSTPAAANLANSTANGDYRAKVIIRDALGNQICQDVAGTFGVDRIAPSIAFTLSTTSQTSGSVASANTGYNVTKVFGFSYSDTISGFNPTTPLRGTLVRNFNAALAQDCVLGTYNAANSQCSFAPLAVNGLGQIEFTGGTAQQGYYTITAVSQDQAGNQSGVITRTAAFDNFPPTVGAVTQGTAAVAPLGSVAVSATATDNFDLASSAARLMYATAPAQFQSQAGTSFGPNFDATLVQSGTATATVSNIFRGLQSTSGTNVILANSAAPSVTVSATDVGRNTTNSAVTAIGMTSGPANVLVNGTNTFSVTPTNAAPAANIATTTLTVRVQGQDADPNFQNQPFQSVEIYQLTATTVNGVIVNELVRIGTNNLASVTDSGNGIRTYTYTFTGVAVPTNPNAASLSTTYYAIGRNAAGDAIIAQPVTIVNPT